MFRRHENPLRQQISSLKAYNHGLEEVEPEKLFALKLQCATGQFTLLINLPSKFPEVPPLVTLVPRATHPWLNAESRVIGLPKIMGQWKQTVNLGECVKQIAKEFKAQPPQPLATANTTLNVTEQDAGWMDISVRRPQQPQAQPPQQQPQMQQERPAPPPPFRSLRPQEPPAALKALSSEQLQSLLDDEEKLLGFIDSLEDVHKLKKDVDELTLTNESTAEKTIESERSMVAMQCRLQQQYEVLARSNGEFQQMIQFLQNINQMYSGENLVALLKQGRNVADGESESLGSAVAAGALDTDQFIRLFLEKRALYHMRAAKLECVDSKQLQM